ncbi:DUF1638 domain-containing protein [Methanosarcina barkeri]|uniref:DUF1638 domain-containing protein n=1 Tax=Methanosarcina barkeri TaxID=2208 RepID=UPI001FB1F321|nr:DUF1638 domain-containing protein [Methanosarcina barkeri]
MWTEFYFFYGSCGQALSRIQRNFAHTRCPIKSLQDRDTDESMKPIEDCIAAALGGNSHYQEILKSHSVYLFFNSYVGCKLEDRIQSW